MQGLYRQWGHQGWPPILAISKAADTGKGSVAMLGCDLCPTQSQPVEIIPRVKDGMLTKLFEHWFGNLAAGVS